MKKAILLLIVASIAASSQAATQVFNWRVVFDYQVASQPASPELDIDANGRFYFGFFAETEGPTPTGTVEDVIFEDPQLQPNRMAIARPGAASFDFHPIYQFARVDRAGPNLAITSRAQNFSAGEYKMRLDFPANTALITKLGTTDSYLLNLSGGKFLHTGRASAKYVSDTGTTAGLAGLGLLALVTVSRLKRKRR